LLTQGVGSCKRKEVFTFVRLIPHFSRSADDLIDSRLLSSRTRRLSRTATEQLNLAPHPFELFDKSCDLLKNALLLGQVLRIERAHFRQNTIEFRAILACELPF